MFILLSKSFSDILHHQCYLTEMKFYFLHFIKTGYYGNLNQYHINTIPLIDTELILISFIDTESICFFLRNHHWLLSVKTSLEAKYLTKINDKTTEEKKDEPICRNYRKIELGNTISKQIQNIGVTLFIQIWSHECYINASRFMFYHLLVQSK